MTRNKLTKIFAGFLAACTALVLTVKIGNYDKDPRLLNGIAQYYFDESYYLNANLDVKNAGVKPFEHYMEYGWKEGRNPSPYFNTKIYIELNPDWNKDKLSPLQHYISSKISLKSPKLHPEQTLKVEPLANPKYQLALVTVSRDEGPYLKEWVEYYRMMGVDHMIVYEHKSTEDYSKILAPYIEEGYIELRHLTYEPKNTNEWNDLQTGAFTEAIRDLSDKAEWMIVLDTDEFFVPMQDDNLKDVLKRFEGQAALCFPFLTFGTGNVDEIPSDKLMIETLLMCEKTTSNQVRYLKSIVKPRYVESFVNPHVPKMKPGYIQVDENLNFNGGIYTGIPSSKYMRVQHYWTRDGNFFQATKIQRVHLKDLGAEEEKKRIEDLYNTNREISATKDTFILKFVPELRKRLGLN